MKKALCAALFAVLASPIRAEVELNPDAALTWVFTEMTCADYLASFDDGLGTQPTRIAVAKQIVMAYQKGIADARGTATAEIGARTGLNCARDQSMRFIDAVMAD